MSETDAEGKRGEAPAPDDAAPDEGTGGGPPAGGMAVPPQRSSHRPGYGGIDEAGLGGGSGDLSGGEVGHDAADVDAEGDE